MHECKPAARTDVVRSDSGPVGEKRVCVIPAERLVPAFHTESDALWLPFVLVGVHHQGRNVEGGSARRSHARVGQRVEVWKHEEKQSGGARDKE